jgi:hypothetical protein
VYRAAHLEPPECHLIVPRSDDNSQRIQQEPLRALRAICAGANPKAVIARKQITAPA